MNLAIALFVLVIGYMIGFCRGWMRGIEETRTSIDARSWRVQPPPVQQDELVVPRGPRL